MRSWPQSTWIALLAVAVAIVMPLTLRFWDKNEEAAKNAIAVAVDTKLKEDGVPQLQNDVGEIKGEISLMNGNITLLLNRGLAKSAALPKAEFSTEMPRVGRWLAVATDLHAPLQPTIVNSLREKLTGDEERNEDYWSAVTAFVTYRSPRDTKQFPPCPSVIAEAQSMASMTKEQTVFPVSMFVPLLRNCRLNISYGLPQITMVPSMSFVKGQLHCYNCQIFYAGNRPVLLENNLKNLKLEHCSFDLHVTEQTPVLGKDFALAVLSASDQSSVKIGHPI